MLTLYQYFVGTPDSEVAKYLRLFTFLAVSKIESIAALHEENPQQRLAQHILATEVTSLIHGHGVALATAKDHQTLFTSSVSTIASDSPVGALSGSVVIIPRSLLASTTMGKLLYHAGLASSASEGRTLVKNGGVYVGRSQVGQVKFMPFRKQPDRAGRAQNIVSWEEIVDGRGKVVLRKGKSSVVIVEIVDDETFVKKGMDFQGSGPWWEEECPESLRKLRGTFVDSSN